MTNNRWITITAIAAATGGLAWLAKLAVIAVTDGRVDNTGAAAFFFLLGAALLAVGGGCIGLRLVRPRRQWANVALLLTGPIVFFVSLVVLEPIAEAVVGNAGPTWLADEAGILATGAFWLTVGLTLLRGSLARSRAVQAV